MTATRVVAATPDEVLQRLARGPRPAEPRPLVLRALGVPVPVHVSGSGLAPGDQWVFHYGDTSHGSGGQTVTRVRAVAADLRADLRDVLRDDVLRGPNGRAAADVDREAADDLEAVLRVSDLGVELQRIDLALDVRHRGVRRVRRLGRSGESLRQALDAIAVTHPDLQTRAELLEQRIVAGQIDLGVAVLAVIGLGHLAAEHVAHQLQAVADAEHRHAELEDHLRHTRAALGSDRERRAREHDALGREGADRLLAHRARVDLAVDVELTNPARNQLGVLAAEIEDQDPLAVGVAHSHSG